jgi:hypothetical protein
MDVGPQEVAYTKFAISGDVTDVRTNQPRRTSFYLSGAVARLGLSVLANESVSPSLSAYIMGRRALAKRCSQAVTTIR